MRTLGMMLNESWKHNKLNEAIRYDINDIMSIYKNMPLKYEKLFGNYVTLYFNDFNNVYLDDVSYITSLQKDLKLILDKNIVKSNMNNEIAKFSNDIDSYMKLYNRYIRYYEFFMDFSPRIADLCKLIVDKYKHLDKTITDALFVIHNIEKRKISILLNFNEKVDAGSDTIQEFMNDASRICNAVDVSISKDGKTFIINNMLFSQNRKK